MPEMRPLQSGTQSVARRNQQTIEATKRGIQKWDTAHERVRRNAQIIELDFGYRDDVGVNVRASQIKPSV